MLDVATQSQNKSNLSKKSSSSGQLVCRTYSPKRCGFSKCIFQVLSVSSYFSDHCGFLSNQCSNHLSLLVIKVANFSHWEAEIASQVRHIALCQIFAVFLNLNSLNIWEFTL